MTGRHYAAQTRVQQFVKAWRARQLQPTVSAIHDADLLVVDLEELMQPRVVIRTLPQLQALPVGTVIMTAAGRAAQVEAREEWDLDTGAEIEAKRLIYVGTDLYDNLLPDPSKEERDTLRRMLPAVVIHPLD